MGNNNLKMLSNSFSTGGGGFVFEHRVQAVFLLFLLIDGFSPVLNDPIKEICFQTKIFGYHTDDLLVKADNFLETKLLCQIKRDITVSVNNKTFKEVISAAWADFNNSTFNKNKDKIGLITGMIAKDVAFALRTLHEKANKSISAESFFIEINTSNYISNIVRKVEKTIEDCIKIANNNIHATREEVWTFLKCFVHLVFDIDYFNSINETLIFSLITAKTNYSAHDAWARLIIYAEECDTANAEICINNIDDRILEIFGKNPIEQNFLISSFTPNDYCAKLAIIGAWNENNKNDISVIEKIVGKPYKEIEKIIKSFLSGEHSWITFKNGVWKVISRKKLIEMCKKYYFDDFIDSVYSIASIIFKEKNKQIVDLGRENVFFTRDDDYNYSAVLREAFLKGICILSNLKELPFCSTEIITKNKYLFINNLFKDCTGERLASLEYALPLIAEISPKDYLDQLEKIIINKSSEIVKLFPDTKYAFSKNYICGVLWSLESLAWSEDYLIKSVRCLCNLAKISTPNTNWGNTPMNSLVSILTPWGVQTLSGVQKIKNAISAALREDSVIAWRLLKKLMPGGVSSINGTSKPKYFLIIPNHYGLSKEEINDLYNYILEQALCVSGSDPIKISDLVQYFNYVGTKFIDDYLTKVDELCLNCNNNDKFPIWLKLNDYKYKLLSEKEYDLKNNKYYKKICLTIEKIEPDELLFKGKRLFLSQFDEFSVDDYSYEKGQEKEHEKARIIHEIYKNYNIKTVIMFARDLKDKAFFVYYYFGRFISKNDMIKLIEAERTGEYSIEEVNLVLKSFLLTNGIQKIYDLNLNSYDKEYISQLLIEIPLSKDIIEVVDNILGDQDFLYWKKAKMPQAYWQNDQYDISVFIEKMEKHNRYATIINWFGNSPKFPYISINILTDVLIKAATIECIDQLSPYAVQRTIKFLQDNDTVDKEKLCKIEFIYLLWINHSAVKPKALRSKIANDYTTFCDFMALLYKKQNNNSDVKKLDKGIGERLYQLFFNFDIIPGTDYNGVFHLDKCLEWISLSLQWGSENDRDIIVQQTIGSGLSYIKYIGDELIDEKIIEVLDDKNNEEMRRGYYLGIINQRGAYTIDPEGKPEKALGEKYKTLANKAEKAGYSRFSDMLREISDKYYKEAENCISEYKLMNSKQDDD